MPKLDSYWPKSPPPIVQFLAWRSNTLIQTTSLEDINEWQAPQGKPLEQRALGAPVKEANYYDAYADGASLSPDGRTCLTGDPKGGYGGLFVRDAKTLAVRRIIKNFTGGFTETNGLVWLPDSKHILLGTKTGFEIINTESGQCKKQWKEPTAVKSGSEASSPVMVALTISGDGKLATVRSMRDNSLLIYDLVSQSFLTRLSTRAGYHARFLQDNQTLVTSAEGGLQWWDGRGDGKKLLRVLPGTPGDSWEFSPDEKLIALGTSNGTRNCVEIWNAEQGCKVITLFLVGGDEHSTSMDWIAVTPEGFYDASPGGEKRLRWRQNGAFWPLEKSRAQFKNPAKVRAALSP